LKRKKREAASWYEREEDFDLKDGSDFLKRVKKKGGAFSSGKRNGMGFRGGSFMEGGPLSLARS